MIEVTDSIIESKEKKVPEVLVQNLKLDPARSALPFSLGSDPWIMVSRHLNFEDFSKLRGASYALHSNVRLFKEFRRRWKLEKWKRWSGDNSELKISWKPDDSEDIEETVNAIWNHCLRLKTELQEYKAELTKICDRIEKKEKILDEEGWELELRQNINKVIETNYNSYYITVLVSAIQFLNRDAAPLASIAQLERSEYRLSNVNYIGGAFFIVGLFVCGVGLAGCLPNSIPWKDKLLPVVGLFLVGGLLIAAGLFSGRGARFLRDRCCATRFFHPEPVENIFSEQATPGSLLEALYNSDNEDDDSVPLLLRIEDDGQNSLRRPNQ